MSIEEGIEALDDISNIDLDDKAKVSRVFPPINSISGGVGDGANDDFKEIELQVIKSEESQSEYLDFPFLDDPSTISWIKRNRIIFVMRGLPGSGKSTLVKAISQNFHDQNPVICSADHYFIDKDGIYKFNPGRLKDAHEASQSSMSNACSDGKKLVIVDNTNVQHWEMKSYFLNANKAPFTYRFIVVEPKTPWKVNPEELESKNTHDVDVETLRKKVRQFELAVPIYFAWFLSPTDSRSLYDRARILLKDLYFSCDAFKEDFAKFSSMLNWGSADNYYR